MFSAMAHETHLLPLSDTARVAAHIGMAPITLRKWRLNGIGPAWIRCGRAVRYRREDVERWLAARTVTSTAQGV
jgi:hypothetical protein